MSGSRNASGELVDASISDAHAVVQAQAVASQIRPMQQVPVTGPSIPASPAPIDSKSVPGALPVPPALPVPGAESEPPAIRAPLAEPMAPPAPLAAPTAAQGVGLGGVGLGAAGLGLSASLGVTSGSFSSAPTMMGDLFGGGVSIIGPPESVVTSAHLNGTIINGSDASAVIAFDFGGGTPNDLFTAAGTGVDVSGDSFVDQFSLLEPLPPTDAPTSPGP